MSKARRWEAPRAVPKRPYRDSALVYGGMAAVIVAVGLLTGGGLLRTLVIAAVFFVVATAWTMWRFRQRLRAQEERE